MTLGPAADSSHHEYVFIALNCASKPTTHFSPNPKKCATSKKILHNNCIYFIKKKKIIENN